MGEQIMCLFTRYIRNKKYTANKKNGGIVPAILDWRTMAVPVKCGECIECCKQRTNEWKIRLAEEIKHDKRGWFCTLTFSEESIVQLANENDIKHLSGYALDNAIATMAVRRFYERHRKDHGKTIKRWLVTEIGGNNTERIHLHGIIWNDLTPIEIAEYWGYGHVKDGRYRPREIKMSYINQKTINYITKYVTKKDFKHPNYKPIILTSNGIGRGYTEHGQQKTNYYRPNNTNEKYIMQNGHEFQLPVYWRNKIYTEEQREQLWIEKLNQGIMYIGGKKIDVSNNLDEYTKWLEIERKKNYEKGYGDGKVEKSIIDTEKQIRALKQQENWAAMGMRWDERTISTT